jgi:CRP-like cAMP-binding protein
MIADLLKQAFDQYYPFPLTVWQSIAELGEVYESGKEEVIKKMDTIEKYLSLIIKGSGGIVLWNKNNFVCTDLVFEGDFFCDYLSFITQTPTPYEVITFEKSQMFRISYENFNKFTLQSEYGDKIWRYSLQVLYTEKHIQQLQFLTTTASELYALILEHQPKFIQRIPQKYIASYLGITTQSLSRIRKNVNQ